MTSGLGWLEPPDALDLRRGEVHVWHASLELPPETHDRLGSTLSSSERERASRFRFDRDRRHFQACRGLLRLLLGRYLKQAPEHIVFQTGAHGKPALSAPQGTSLSFNVSHSGGCALLAFSVDAPLGVDLERLRPLDDLAELARRTFSEAEARELLSLAEADRLRGFFTCWTRKEAFIKAVGEGLSFPLDRFEVTLRPDELPRLRHLEGDPEASSRWQLTDLPLGSDFAAAIAVRGGADVRRWRWSDRA